MSAFALDPEAVQCENDRASQREHDKHLIPSSNRAANTLAAPHDKKSRTVDFLRQAGQVLDPTARRPPE